MTTSAHVAQGEWVPGADTFGARLALLRHAKGWNVKEAALACGIPAQSWRNWEEGRRPQGLIDACVRIASATGVSYDWLLDGRTLAVHARGGGPANVLDRFATYRHGSSHLGNVLATVIPFPSRPANRLHTVRERSLTG